MTGEIITVDDEQLAKMRKASESVRRARAEELADRGCVHTACDVPANRTAQVRINVNVQALRLEYKPGWFDFFRSEPGMRCLARDRFTVAIAADAHSSDVLSLIEKISSLFVPTHHFSNEASDAPASVQCTPSTYATVCDDDSAPDSRRTGAPALDIWV